MQVALDVSSDGQLQLPPYPSNPKSAIWNITIFLSSYVTGWNFTISNGTAWNGSLGAGEIMGQENGSTVKHVNWVWPDCLVGKGAPSVEGVLGHTMRLPPELARRVLEELSEGER